MDQCVHMHDVHVWMCAYMCREVLVPLERGTCSVRPVQLLPIYKVDLFASGN